MCCGDISYLDNESTLGCREEERFEPKLSMLPLFSIFSASSPWVTRGVRCPCVPSKVSLTHPQEYCKSPHTKGSCHLFPAASQSPSQTRIVCRRWCPLPADTSNDLSHDAFAALFMCQYVTYSFALRKSRHSRLFSKGQTSFAVKKWMTYLEIFEWKYHYMHCMHTCIVYRYWCFLLYKISATGLLQYTDSFLMFRSHCIWTWKVECMFLKVSPNFIYL